LVYYEYAMISLSANMATKEPVGITIISDGEFMFELGCDKIRFCFGVGSK